VSKFHSKVVHSAGHFHDQISEACFGVTKLVFNDATTFHAGQGVFNDDANTGHQMIEGFVDHA